MIFADSPSTNMHNAVASGRIIVGGWPHAFFSSVTKRVARSASSFLVFSAGNTSTTKFSMSAPFRHLQVEELAFCPDGGWAPIPSCSHSPLRAGEGLAISHGRFSSAHRRAFARAISSAAAAISALVMSLRVASAAH